MSGRNKANTRHTIALMQRPLRPVRGEPRSPGRSGHVSFQTRPEPFLAVLLPSNDYSKTEPVGWRL